MKRLRKRWADQVKDAHAVVFGSSPKASRLRLRPILITSFAFIRGVLAWCFASGAGAEMRRSLGMAVFSGMLGVTLFGIFLTPVFFYVIQGLGEAPLFAGVVTQWVLACVQGGFLGMASGFLLARLGVVPLFWGLCNAFVKAQRVRAKRLTCTVIVRTIVRMETKKRGRQPKQQRQQLREEYLEVRLETREKQAFKDAAELAGLSLSAWLRDRMRRVARQELQESGRKVAFLEEAGGNEAGTQ